MNLPIDPNKIEKERAAARIRDARYRAAHPEREKARHAAYFAAHREEELARIAQWKADHPEEAKAAAAAWWDAHPEKGAEYQAAWRTRHPEKVAAGKIAQAAYEAEHRAEISAKETEKRRANPEAYNAKKRAQYAKNPAAFAARNNRHRALKLGATVCDLTAKEWKAIKEHYGHRCVYCGKKSQRLTQEHLTPLSLGGDHTYTNVVPACRLCNSTRGNRAVLAPVQPLLLI